MVANNFSQVIALGGGDESFIETFIEQSTQELASYLSCIKEGVETKNIYWLNFIQHKSKTLFDLLCDNQNPETISYILNSAKKDYWELEDKLEILEKDIRTLITKIRTELKIQEV
jgi:hypothetical protein